jgi:hypothetical protein
LLKLRRRYLGRIEAKSLGEKVPGGRMRDALRGKCEWVEGELAALTPTLSPRERG